MSCGRLQSRKRCWDGCSVACRGRRFSLRASDGADFPFLTTRRKDDSVDVSKSVGLQLLADDDRCGDLGRLIMSSGRLTR